jgi:hypothetical protein
VSYILTVLVVISVMVFSMKKIIGLMALCCVGGLQGCAPAPAGVVYISSVGACPAGYHLGPYGQYCWPPYACPAGYHINPYRQACVPNGYYTPAPRYYYTY